MVSSFVTAGFCCLGMAALVEAADAPRTLNVLFIGNSFTGRHNLSQIVKALAEEGNPGLRFEVTPLLYSGTTLERHWRLGTGSFVRLADLTIAEEQGAIASIEAMRADGTPEKHVGGALRRHRELLANLDARRKRWDLVVLQSYNDDADGEKSSYAEYARKFVELVKTQGGRAVLYETVPRMQNAKPLAAAPDPGPATAKAEGFARLAGQLDVAVAPMSLVILRCQTERPDLTFRYASDFHPNHTMAYATACTLYAACFGRSPEGLTLEKVTDNKPLDDAHADKDRDGGPITHIFSAKDRADLQRFAWEGYRQFEAMRQ